MRQAGAAMEGGQLSEKEQHNLESVRLSLGIDADEARQMLDKVEMEMQAPQVCPHCGKPLYDDAPS